MKTAKEKYENDPAYHRLVQVLYSMIAEYQFTPSELREAVVFAATKYEMENCRTPKHQTQGGKKTWVNALSQQDIDLPGREILNR
jgi:restriction endonuclease Mrr